MVCKFILIIFTLLPYFCFSNNLDNKLDSSYQVLIKNIDEFYDNPSNALPFIKKYITKSKAEKNYRHLFYAYKEAIYATTDIEIKKQYADSLIKISKKLNHSDWMVQAFQSKGLVLYQNKELTSALKQYKLAYNAKDNQTDAFLIAKLNLNTAIILIHLLQFEDAEKILNKNLEYYKTNLSNEDFKTYYLNTLYYLGKLNQKNRNYKLAELYNSKGLDYSIETADRVFIDYFKLACSIDEFFKNKYNEVIIKLTNLEKGFINKNDFNTLATLYYFKGYSNLHLNNKNEAIKYLVKVDSIFNIHPHIDTDYRNIFKTLYSHELEKGNSNKQLYYVNQLIKYDNINEEIVSNLPVQAKKIIDIEKLNKNNNTFKFINSDILPIGLIILFECILLTFNIKNKYFSFFKSNRSNKNLTGKSEIGLNQELVDQILYKLNQFEVNNKFIDPDISLNRLAADLNTNALYLSTIINKYKKTNFNNYINSLRIKYIVELINNNNKYQNYSLKGLALEVGFKTARHFSNQFLKFKGVKPLDYINNIKINGLNNDNNSN